MSKVELLKARLIKMQTLVGTEMESYCEDPMPGKMSKIKALTGIIIKLNNQLIDEMSKEWQAKTTLRWEVIRWE